MYSIASSLSANAVGNGDEDEDVLSVPAAVGITFVVTLVLSVFITLVIVYIVYKMKKKPAKDEARVAFSSTLMTNRASTIKVSQSSCDDENYKLTDNMEQAESETRYQKSPTTTMQANPTYGVPQSTYENVN